MNDVSASLLEQSISVVSGLGRQCKGICMPDCLISATVQVEASEVAVINQDSDIHNGWGGTCQGASWLDIRGGMCSALDKCAEAVQPIWIGFGILARLKLSSSTARCDWAAYGGGREGKKKVFLIIYTLANDTLGYWAVTYTLFPSLPPHSLSSPPW